METANGKSAKMTDVLVFGVRDLTDKSEWLNCIATCNQNIYPNVFDISMNVKREKGRDLTQSYDKSPYTNRNVKRAKWQHKQRHKSSIT